MGSSLSSASFSAPNNSVGIRPVKVHEAHSDPERRGRRLIHLLRLNHANFGVLFNELRFHNHMPHILGSAYILGSTDKQLDDIYDAESKSGLEPWPESPNEIARHDWRSHLGDKRYERAFLDFFEDELVSRFSYDWKATLAEYLFSGSEPLVNGLIGGLGHPLIHLGYAIELDNRELAMEALTQGSCEYNFLHEYPDNESNHNVPAKASKSPLDLINLLRNDINFNDILTSPGSGNRDKLFDKLEPQIATHIYSLKIEEGDEARVLEKLADTAISVFITGQKRDDPQYDFFLVHLVTTAHAVRILLPYLPAEHVRPILRAHWTLFVICYLTQMRPLIKEDLIVNYQLEKSKDWDYVVDKSVNGEHRLDPHYVKALRAMKEFAETFGEKDGFYLKAAVKFADEFKSFVGFGDEDESRLDITK